MEEHGNRHRAAGVVRRVHRTCVVPIQRGHAGQFDLGLCGNVGGDDAQVVLGGVERGQGGLAIQLRGGVEAAGAQVPAQGRGRHALAQCAGGADAALGQHIRQPLVKPVAPVQALHLVQVVQYLHGLPQPLGQAGALEHGVDEVTGVVVAFVLAVHEAGHGNVGHHLHQPVGLGCTGRVQRRQHQRGDRPRGRAAQRCKTQPGLLQQIDVSRQGNAQHTAAFHHQVHVLAACGVQGVAVVLVVQPLGAHLRDRRGCCCVEICGFQCHVFLPVRIGCIHLLDQPARMLQHKPGQCK
ncbi:hypothetical protein D3C72_1250490 [compost metagenome]